jgi:hypothetical protein
MDRDKTGHVEHSSLAEQERPYPERPVVIGVIGSGKQVGELAQALAAAGVPASDIDIAHGHAAAERLRGTGRTGWAHLAARLTERLGIPNDEIALRNRYEEELRNGEFVVAVLAPDDARKDLVARLMSQHGGTFVNYFDRYTFQVMRAD